MICSRRFAFRAFCSIACCLRLLAAAAQNSPVPSLPLRSEEDLDTLLRMMSRARIVLLGEASHGTSDYHRWRSIITRRLIREQGFRCIAIEGEWADCYRVNEWIGHGTGDSTAAAALLQGFGRWPAWMWGNAETVQLLRWLHADNRDRPESAKIGFYGLDLYCVWESLEALERRPVADTGLRRAITAAWQCFLPYGPDAMSYARALLRGGNGCREVAGRLWVALKAQEAASRLTQARFALGQYGLVVSDGERYFRNINSGAPAWNLRENHMYTTIRRLLSLYGPDARIVVWAHNTHVGDARASTMSARRKLSLGQLLRQAYGDTAVFLTGMGAYTGTLLSGRNWGDTARLVGLPPARPGSWEELLHRQWGSDRIVPCAAFRSMPALNGYYYTRGAGVIYQPASDAYSSYTASMMARRYDAFIFLDHTEALHPLPGTTHPGAAPYLYPSGE